MNHLRRNLVIAVFVCLAADLLLLGWLLSPKAPSRAANRQQLTEARTRYIQVRAQDAQLQLLSQRLHTSQQQIQELMAAGIPGESDASSKLLTEFSRLAGISQVQVSGAEFHPDKNAQLGLRRVGINLQVAGSYGGVVRFLNQLERSHMFFILDQVGVSGGPGEAANQVKLELQLEAYVRTGA